MTLTETQTWNPQTWNPSTRHDTANSASVSLPDWRQLPSTFRDTAKSDEPRISSFRGPGHTLGGVTDIDEGKYKRYILAATLAYLDRTSNGSFVPVEEVEEYSIIRQVRGLADLVASSFQSALSDQPVTQATQTGPSPTSQPPKLKSCLKQTGQTAGTATEGGATQHKGLRFNPSVGDDSKGTGELANPDEWEEKIDRNRDYRNGISRPRTDTTGPKTDTTGRSYPSWAGRAAAVTALATSGYLAYQHPEYVPKYITDTASLAAGSAASFANTAYDAASSYMPSTDAFSVVASTIGSVASTAKDTVMSAGSQAWDTASGVTASVVGSVAPYASTAGSYLSSAKDYASSLGVGSSIGTALNVVKGGTTAVSAFKMLKGVMGGLVDRSNGQ